MRPAFLPTLASGQPHQAISQPARRATIAVPLLRAPGWLIGLPLAGLAAWLSLAEQGTAPDSALQFGGAAGLLVVAALGVALWTGRLARSARASRHGDTDEATGLLNPAGLAARGEDLLARCRRAGRPCSVVVLNFDDLAEAGRIYNEALNRQLAGCIVSRLRQLAGRNGLVARTGKTQFTLVVPGAGREKTMRSMARTMGFPARIELDSGGEEIVLVPDTIAENAAPGDDSLSQICRELARDLARQQQDEARRCHYLQRERERHSRPMVLAVLPDGHARAHLGSVAQREAQTVPVPMAARD